MTHGIGLRPPVPGVYRVTPPGLDALLAARGVDPVVTGTAARLPAQTGKPSPASSSSSSRAR
jgi:hypothetical protein